MDAQPSDSTPRIIDVTRHLIRAMRPVQWVKNVFVLAPLVFGLALLDGGALLLSSITFAMFCLISSAVYLLNDISDREADRRHPTKKNRPIASGALSVEVARLAMAFLVLFSLGGALLIDWRVALVLGSYFVLNVAYTMQLKRIAFVDITCIALGFLLRVVAGSLAIGVEASGWLLACTFLLASLLALGKRRHELMVVHREGKSGSTRAVLDSYRVTHIDFVVRALAVVTIVSYTLYTISDATVAHFGTSTLVYTVPFVFFGLYRFSTLVGRVTDAQSPTDTMVRDVPFLLIVGTWAVLSTTVIYLQL